jgi:hypothetical protein
MVNAKPPLQSRALSQKDAKGKLKDLMKDLKEMEGEGTP